MATPACITSITCLLHHMALLSSFNHIRTNEDLPANDLLILFQLTGQQRLRNKRFHLRQSKLHLYTLQSAAKRSSATPEVDNAVEINAPPYNYQTQNRLPNPDGNGPLIATHRYAPRPLKSVRPEAADDPLRWNPERLSSTGSDALCASHFICCKWRKFWN